MTEYAMKYIDGYVAAQVLFLSIRTGILESYRNGSSHEDICSRLRIDPDIYNALAQYLQFQGVVELGEDKCILTTKGETLLKERGWIEMFVGGYGTTLANLGSVLGKGKKGGKRNDGFVALGSGHIDEYDVIPLLQSILYAPGKKPLRLFDIGCGAGNVIISLAAQDAVLQAHGFDPSVSGIRLGSERVRLLRLSKRVTFSSGNIDRELRGFKPDTVLACFSLHEKLYQIGRARFVSWLRKAGVASGSALWCIVEVERLSNCRDLSGDKGIYYRNYFLMHDLTPQALLSLDDWKGLFYEAGFQVEAVDRVSALVDPLQLEFAARLRR
jgi:hypothetical protein